MSASEHPPTLPSGISEGEGGAAGSASSEATAEAVPVGDTEELSSVSLGEDDTADQSVQAADAGVESSVGVAGSTEMPTDARIPASSGTGAAKEGKPSSTAVPAEAPPLNTEKGKEREPVILGIAVVDFNHLVGPQVEYTHPKSLLEDEELCKTLPFLALPDGSHLSDEDFCYFHLLCPDISPSTIFGISCNRQIASNALLRKGAEVTRSTVQKAVVVLAREPVFGPIKEKLGVVTRAYFAQGDLAETDILAEFHETLEAGLQGGGFDREKEAVLHMGTSLRELVYKWRWKTLVLLKLLLLQRKIMFFGYPVERLCTYQYSLVSLVPGLLLSLQDAGDPKMDNSDKRAPAESLKTSDPKSLLRYMGLPLQLFGQHAFFQPYLPLQQIDMLKCDSWLVGTSNSIFRQQKDCHIDVVVDLEHTQLDFLNPHLAPLAGLTAADRKWMDEIVHVVVETWNADDPSRPTSMRFVGSDDYLRAKFEGYICSLLSSIKYDAFVNSNQGQKGGVSIVAPDSSSISSFGAEFAASLRTTAWFSLWNAHTDPMLFDIVDAKHPCEGKTSSLEDVAIRLSAGLHDLRLEENLAPTRDAIGQALQAGGQNVWRMANKFGTDLARLRREHLLKTEEGAGAGAGGAGDGVAQHARTGTDAASAASPSGGSSSPAALTAQQAADRAAAAAAQAGTQVRAALGSFGSFLASRQKAWAAGAGAGAGSAGASAPSSPSAAATSPSPQWKELELGNSAASLPPRGPS